MSDSTPLAVVTGQVETVAPGPDGRPQPVVNVSFRTRSGAVGSVYIPQSAYSPEAVFELVKERATTMEAVANLTVP